MRRLYQGGRKLTNMRHVEVLSSCAGICLSILLACGSPAVEEDEDLEPSNHPVTNSLVTGSEYALGRGIDYSEGRFFSTCIDFDEPIRTIAGFEERRYTEKRIESQEDLNQALGISATAAAKGMWGTAGVGAAYYKGVHISQNSIYWMVDAKYDLGSEQLDTSSKQFKLSDMAKKVLQGPRPIETFHEVCGEIFLSSRKLGVRYGLLYEFKTTDQEEAERMAASANYSGFGADVAAELTSSSQMARKSNRVEIHTLIAGGDAQLNDYALDAQHLKSELSQLRVSALDEGKYAVLSYSTTPYSIFPEYQEAAQREQSCFSNTAILDRNLQALYEMFLRNTKIIEEIERLFDASNGVDAVYVFAQDDVTYMKNVRSALIAANAGIESRAKDCLSGDKSACTYADIELISWTPPAPVEDGTSLHHWVIDLVADPRDEDPENIVFFALRMREANQSVDEAHIYMSPFSYLTYVGTLGKIALRGFTYKSKAIGYEIIGDDRNVYDGTNSHIRPNLCLGEHASMCVLRVVSRGQSGIGGESNIPPKIQIITFTRHGLVDQKIDFYRS